MKTIQVSSRALGHRETVRVCIYDTVEQMRSAATRFNGADHHDSLGTAQVSERLADGHLSVTIRLAKGHLGTQVVSHELHHATTAIYGAHVGKHATARTHLTHYNEPFAHLYSDMMRSLVDRLYTLGYYPGGDDA